MQQFFKDYDCLIKKNIFDNPALIFAIKKEIQNTVWTEFHFIYEEKHSLSLRLTFCLSP